MGLVKQKMIFVVGNSRSGTTMMGRILGGNPEVFTFGELHFFEQLWSGQSSTVQLLPEQANNLASRLLATQREGYYRPHHISEFKAEASYILATLESNKEYTPPQIFSAFLIYETKRSQKIIPCDHTPRNLFYLPEILDNFSCARVINMVRDPRDVMLSQKRRWKRRFLGSGVPLRNTIRVWSNYHPITISMLWNSGIKAGDRFSEHPRIMRVRFEDMVAAPLVTLYEICDFLQIKPFPEMLNVPHLGSSHDDDQVRKYGIRQAVAGRWRHGGLSNSELLICETISGQYMVKHGYELTNLQRRPIIGVAPQVLTWALKSSLAFLLNVRRTNNFIEAFMRRTRSRI